MATCDCCGCVFASDYGTSEITGVGTVDDPFVLSTVDPAWQRPYARIIRTSGFQTISTGASYTALTLVTESFDVGNFWSAGAPTRLTAPENGMYIFGGTCGLVSVPTNTTIELGIRLNGSQLLTVVDQNQEAVHAAILEPRLLVTYQYFMNAGDYIELVIRHEAGSNRNTLNDTSEGTTFWIMYAGRVI